jgi:hypothetical protein
MRPASEDGSFQCLFAKARLKKQQGNIICLGFRCILTIVRDDQLLQILLLAKNKVFRPLYPPNKQLFVSIFIC